MLLQTAILLTLDKLQRESFIHVMTTNKSFLFLYPQEEIFAYELRNKDESFVRKYQSMLNECIDRRYRQKGFSITYALLDDCCVWEGIVVRETDAIIKVGMDAHTHHTAINGKYPYPDEEQIISQLGKIELLRVGGFHTYDCCSRVARRAYEKGMDVLVDEDLTQFFPLVFEHSHFKIDDYPLVNPRDEIIRQHLWELFLANRRNKPWFIQNFDW